MTSETARRLQQRLAVSLSSSVAVNFDHLDTIFAAERYDDFVAKLAALGTHGIAIRPGCQRECAFRESRDRELSGGRTAVVAEQNDEALPTARQAGKPIPL